MSASRLRSVFWSGVVALLCCTPASAESQTHTLKVRVTDPAGQPVAGARITASPRDARLSIARQTDSAGEVRIEVPLAGTLVLQVKATGFVSSVRTVAVRTALTEVTVVLALATVTEHVVVTGEDHLQTTAEVSKAVTVIDADEIATRNEFSVADALRTVPGLTVQQLGGPGSFTSVKLRGLREQDTSFLIDGVRFRDAASPQGDATAFVGELYVANLDRIEVLRGSGSSLYGSHAIGGAVNLITARGSGRPVGDISAEIGALGYSRMTARTSGGVPGDRVTFSVGLGHTRTVRGIDGDDDAENTSIQGQATMNLAASSRATVRIYASDATSLLNDSPGAIGPLPATGFVQAGPATFSPAANDPDSVRDSNFTSMLLQFEQRPSAAFGYTLSFHRLRSDRMFLDGPLGASAFEPVTPTFSGFKGAVDTLAVRADRQWSPRHTSRVTYEFERERYLSDAAPVNPALAWRADITQDSHTASVHHEVRFDPLQLSASVRAQRFVLDDVALVPSERAPFAAASFRAPPGALTADIAATRWIAPSGTKLRVHAGNAYRAPAMFERAGVSFGSRGYRVFGDPEIEPERSVAVDAGVDQTLLKGRAVISVTWFHTRLSRVISFQSLDPATDPSSRTSGYRSADGRSARGVEVSARIRPHATFHALVSYTFVDAPPPTGDPDGLPRAAAVSAHQWSGLITQRLGPLQLSFDLEAAGDHYVTLFDPVSFGARAYRFGARTKADVTASYRVPHESAEVRVFATIENVLGRTYFVQGFRAADRVARGGVAVAF